MSKYLGTDHESKVRINNRAENPLVDFGSMDILEPEILKSIMVGEECTVHVSYFELE